MTHLSNLDQQLAWVLRYVADEGGQLGPNSATFFSICEGNAAAIVEALKDIDYPPETPVHISRVQEGRTWRVTVTWGKGVERLGEVA